ncbi:hypothetical protein ABZ570_29395 [Micromonospora sp. NPDC007271]
MGEIADGFGDQGGEGMLVAPTIRFRRHIAHVRLDVSRGAAGDD